MGMLENEKIQHKLYDTFYLFGNVDDFHEIFDNSETLIETYELHLDFFRQNMERNCFSLKDQSGIVFDYE